MGNRYVWGKYTVGKEAEKTTASEFSYYYSGNLTSSTIVAYAGSQIVKNSDGSFSLSGNVTVLYYGKVINAATYPYVARERNGNEEYIYYPGASASYWHGSAKRVSGTPYNFVFLSDDSSVNTSDRLDFSKFTNVPAKGTFVENVSSSSKTAYPTTSGGAVSGNYWYIYQGEDNIDPLGIAYQMDELRPGDKITISVSKSSSIKYGGTISYLYQYQLNGGSWTNIQTTSAESISFTVPSNAKTIRFRVRAQDDMGFVSTTYVTGDTAGVERLNLWIGVNGKARKGAELYVGVNGKARKVVAAYIGVNGKARRFL